MAIKASTGGSGDFELVPAGVYLARCYQMVDIGTQTILSQKYGKQSKRQVILYWELLQDDDGKDFFMEDGKRVFSTSQLYTLSMNKKARLRADLDSWRGVPFTEEEADGFDITKLLDKFCKLQIVHNKSGDKTYANVSSIMSTKKTAPAVNPVVEFSVDEPDMKAFEGLPQWLQDKIKESAEWEDDAPVDTESEPAAEEEDKKIDISGVPF